ncbi:hypothetical protein RHSIM_Rhsim13G0163300 [Rhododendron simsii]|uniref:Uncharacterized protein n=1 Tax=Rhododendron simsii TaxID=118357 RepID=A0A834G069_RHOSS|nr:hypothetical protein RHSIM_Rhsim13G0163300 [Rhododendron simsii]
MARFLILCTVLAELISIFMGKTNGSESLDLIAPAVFGPRDVPVPSPAPSYRGNDSGIGNIAGNRRVTRHHSSDNSAAGGDVILGGFATALVGAILSYIRITRRNQHATTEK